MVVRSFHSWPTNADLIADVAELGYIGERVLDLSYGRGVFWRKWKPKTLISNDIDTTTAAQHNHDVTVGMPLVWLDNFDTVVWDGPYRLSGKRDHPMDERYGTGGDYRSVKDTQTLLEAGVAQAFACTHEGGTVLVKAQNQVSGGKKRWQVRNLAVYAESCGGIQIDEFWMISSPRKQPPGRGQKTARSNASCLMVFSA